MSIDFNSKSALPESDTAYHEAERLIATLHTWGIHYLFCSTESTYAEEHISSVEFIRRLAQCPFPRVRDASIALFLLHPELAPAILEAYENSPTNVAEQIVMLTLATLYLQRMWSYRLTLALGHTPTLPEQPFMQWWQKRGLPTPVCNYGKAGLYALQIVEQQRRGMPLDFVSDWQNALDHLIFQEEARQHKSSKRTAITEIWNTDVEEQECNEMSMRSKVTKAEIEKFLQTLGRVFRQPGRLYLAGGAALVHLGIRSGSTVDIDVVIEASDEDAMVTAIRRIVEQMQINVDFTSPGDFIPLPTQWSAHARYVGRYGTVDVFYFDFYSLALSKISRGTDRDLVDVKLLYQQGTITLTELDAAYREILPRMGKRPYLNLNPQRFTERYTLVHQQLAAM